MKRRLISLLLVLIMAMICFAGCGEESREEIMKEIGKEASTDAETISLYLMSEKPVSKEQEERMEKAVNEITETGYTIHVDLKYFTPDEYYEKLEADLEKMEEYYGSGDAGKKKDNPVYVDENGLPKVHYPKIESFDVNVFYFGGYEKYIQYKSAGYLRDVSTEFVGASKAMKAAINNKLVNQFKEVNGVYDAIPTNRAIGEYTYILVDKDVWNAAKYKRDQITSLVCDGCRDILSMVSNDANYSDKFVPLYSSVDDINVADVKYFGISAADATINKFSILAGTYNSSWVNGAENSYPVMDSLFNSANNGNYTVSDQLEILKSYELNGYYGTKADEGKPFALGYVKGSFDVIEKYGDDYEIIPVENPTLTNKELYESLFAVAKYANDEKASMQILTLLNTNEEFRNLILYGVEGENYVWEDSEILDKNGNPYRVVARQEKDPDKLYVMDPLKTGNVALAYTAKGEDPRAKGYIYDHNDGIVVDYVLGFSFYEAYKSKAITKETYEDIIELTEKSLEAYEELRAAENPGEVAAAMLKLKNLENSDEYKAIMDTENSESAITYYTEWLVEKGLIYREPNPDDEIIVK